MAGRQAASQSVITSIPDTIVTSTTRWEHAIKKVFSMCIIQKLFQKKWK